MIMLADQYEFHVSWEPFLLHPECPMEGIVHNQPLGGDPDDLGVNVLKEINLDLGIDFNFRCPVIPNTIYAHILSEYSKTASDGVKHNHVVDRLFKAYFTKGRALEKRHILSVGENAGLNVPELDKLLDDPAKVEAIKEKAAMWRNMGIEATPFMFMNGHSVFSGDQDETALASTINKVAAKFPMGQKNTSL